MRILVMSDTHRQHANFIEVTEKIGKLDLAVHLGDAEGYEDLIAEHLDCPLEIIAGNNDFFSRLEKEKIIYIGDYKVLLTHGQYYYVSVGLEGIRKEAIGRGADIVMFGHTHRPLIAVEEEVTMINPGSLSYPRQEGKRPSYIIMEIDREGQAHYTIHYL